MKTIYKSFDDYRFCRTIPGFMRQGIKKKTQQWKWVW